MIFVSHMIAKVNQSISYLKIINLLYFNMLKNTCSLLDNNLGEYPQHFNFIVNFIVNLGYFFCKLID